MLEFVRFIYFKDGVTAFPNGDEIPADLVDQARKFKAGRSWRQRFYARWNMVTRKRTNKTCSYLAGTSCRIEAISANLSLEMDLESSELQDGALKPILDASMTRPRIGNGLEYSS